MGKYFGTDGVRGFVNESLTPFICYRIGRYIGSISRKIVVGTDTRISGDLLKTSLVSGILASGASVYDVGIMPTAFISYLMRNFDFDLGVMISASHNAFNDNGIKIFNKLGEKLEENIEDLIEEYIDSPIDSLPFAIDSNIGKLVTDTSEYRQKYFEFLMSLVSKDLKNLNIIVDLANGANSFFVPELFKSLGMRATYINDLPDGININLDCGSTHIQCLREHMLKKHYDLGLAFDGDGDRMIMVGNDNSIIDGDKIIFLMAQKYKRESKLNKDSVVITVMSNIGLRQALSKNNMHYVITPVGDKYVQKILKENNLTLGGEKSGHIIFIDDLNTGDGIITGLKMLELFIEEKKNFKKLLKDYKEYPQILYNVKVNNKKTIMESQQLKNKINEIEEKIKGDGRILVRASGTENIIRVMVETKSIKKATKFANEVSNLIAKL